MKRKHKGIYFLDLADNGYWLIKNEAGYRECIGVGDEGKKKAVRKIERLNKKEKEHSYKRYAISPEYQHAMIEVYLDAVEDLIKELSNAIEKVKSNLTRRIDNLRNEREERESKEAAG